MHIPDGYLSPSTCAVGAIIAIPIVATAAVKVKDRVKTKNVPTLAVLAAVCFLIMMFNVPIPDGTTAHAVGGSLVAIVLGPWAAVVAVTVALVFQALLFGDGGVLSLGVNVFNMAIVLPFVSYGLYRLISGGATLTSPRRVAAAFVSGYLGINAAALACGIELGIQPDLFQDASGAPLYSPYHLSQSVPAMLLAHLTVAGVAEGILSAAVLAYLQRANLPLLKVNHPGVPVDAAAAEAEQKRRRKLRPGVVALVVMGLLVILTPLGLLAPGGAFGEDGPDELPLSQLGLSAIPAGLDRYAGFWQDALFPDYLSDSPWTYIVSAIIGILVVGAAVYVIVYLLVKAFSRGRAAQDSDTDSETVDSTEHTA